MQEITYKDLNILFEDNHIIVVVKPFNIPTQADVSGDLDMLSLIKDYIVKTYNKTGNAYVGMVHRLDRPTGGVMVFAKTSKGASRLSENIVEGDFEKKYLTVLCGVPKAKNGRLIHYLRKNPVNNTVMICPMSTEGAKKAELDYKILEENNGYCLAQINLLTGRSHQIRVQMASLGTPVFGDSKYGAEERTYKYNLALWAYEIKFPHPTTKEMMVFRVYPPIESSPWKGFSVNRHLNISIKDLEQSQ